MRSTTQPSFQGHRVLIVEDDYLVATDLKQTFQSAGADVVGPIGDIDMAADIVRSDDRIDAAVVDINVHGEMAFPLVDILVRQDVPVAFYTGYAADVLPYRLRHLEVHEKPANPRTVVAAIGRLVGGHAPKNLSRE